MGPLIVMTLERVESYGFANQPLRKLVSEQWKHPKWWLRVLSYKLVQEYRLMMGWGNGSLYPSPALQRPFSSSAETLHCIGRLESVGKFSCSVCIFTFLFTIIAA